MGMDWKSQVSPRYSYRLSVSSRKDSFFLPEEFDKHLPGDDDYVFHKEKFVYEKKADALALPIVPMGRSIEKQIFVLRNEGQSPDEKNVRRFSLRGFDFEMPIEPEEDEIEPRLLKCHVNVEMSLFFGNTISFTYRFLFNGHSGTLSAPVGIDHIIALLSTWLGAAGTVEKKGVNWAEHLKERARYHVSWPEYLLILQMVLAKKYVIGRTNDVLIDATLTASHTSSLDLIGQNAKLSMRLSRMVLQLDVVKYSKFASHLLISN